MREGAQRITYVIGTYPSLTTTFIDREIGSLADRGYDVRIIAVRRPRGELSPRQRQLGTLTEYVLPPHFARLALAQVRWFLRRPLRYLSTLLHLLTRSHEHAPRLKSAAHFLIGAEVASRMSDRSDGWIHAHFADRAATIAFVASRLLDMEYSLTAHANDIYLKPNLLPMKIGQSRFTVTCTGYNLDHLREVLPPHAGRKVRLLYHGLELRDYADIRPPTSGQIALVSVGQLKEKKGLRHLVSAAAILREQGLRIECRIVGDGPLREDLNAQVSERSLGDQVMLVGARPHPEVVNLYRQSHIFVLPCVVADDGDRDGIPNAILEAMASGLAVVSTPVSGIPEVVRDGETGLLVPPGDADALAGAIRRLIEDADLRRRLGDAGRALVTREFDAERNVDRFVEALAAGG